MFDAGTTNLTTAIRVSVNSDECRKIHYYPGYLPMQLPKLRAKAHATTQVNIQDIKYRCIRINNRLT